MSTRTRTSSWRDLARVDYAEAEQGKWRIAKFTVSEDASAFDRLHARLNGSRRWTPPGSYTALRRGHAHNPVMSDTPNEIDDLAEFWYALEEYETPRVLIHGLGLGCALRLALAADAEHVDVVEVDTDVIALIRPYFQDDLNTGRLTIHLGDAYTYRFAPHVRWDVAWHDIWDDISSDNDFATLHRRYGRRASWQGSWCRAESERNRGRW